MTDEKKAIEQALEAAAAELKAKGAAAVEAAPQEPAPETPAAAPTSETPAEAPEVPEKAEREEAKAPDKAGKKPAHGDKKHASGGKKLEKKPAGKSAGKSSAAALKELKKVRRNKIIGITAAALAVMAGIFFIARRPPAEPSLAADHGGQPTVVEDGTKVYPDGTKEYTNGYVEEPDGTVTAPDGTVTEPNGTVKTPDGAVVTPPAVQPGDSNVGNVAVDDGAAGAAVETPWSTMTDGDYQISIRRLNAWSGPFVEDGKDETVSNVLALQFRNDGEMDVQYAEYVFQINGEEVSFKLTNLPAKQKCVVFAANKHTYDPNEVLKLKSRLVATVDYLPTADDQILPVNNGDDTVTVLNMTDQPIPVARVFYKTYYPEEETFFGGITYTIEIKDIPAGGSRTVAPEHFSSEMSMFVGSGVYDS